MQLRDAAWKRKREAKTAPIRVSYKTAQSQPRSPLRNKIAPIMDLHSGRTVVCHYCAAQLHLWPVNIATKPSLTVSCWWTRACCFFSSHAMSRSSSNKLALYDRYVGDSGELSPSSPRVPGLRSFYRCPAHDFEPYYWVTEVRKPLKPVQSLP